jgi:hypothetical protein
VHAVPEQRCFVDGRELGRYGTSQFCDLQVAISRRYSTKIMLIGPHGRPAFHYWLSYAPDPHGCGFGVAHALALYIS